MRHFIAYGLVIATLADPASGIAAVASASFTVGATVEASCSIETKRLLQQPQDAIRSPFPACGSVSPNQTNRIPARQPQISLVRDPAAGVTRLTIEF